MSPERAVSLEAVFQKDIRLFREFPAAAARGLARRSAVRRYSRGERVCEAGRPARSVWALLEGRVVVHRRHWNGRKVGIEIMVPGDVFGLPALTHWSSPSEIEAALDSRVAEIPREAMLKAMEEHAQVSRAVFALISRRLRFIESQLFLAQEPVETRLAAALVYLAEKFGPRLPLTHGEIGEMAATTPETTMRRLKLLAARGVIRRRRGEVEIVDADRLRALVARAG